MADNLKRMYRELTLSAEAIQSNDIKAIKWQAMVLGGMLDLEVKEPRHVATVKRMIGKLQSAQFLRNLK